MRPTILLVEDEAEIREPLAELLTSAGYEVLAAEDGRDALTRAGARPIAAVVTDLMMPGMDGWTLIAELRRRADLATVPIIVVSASSEVPVAGTELLRKPFAADALVGRLRATVTT